MAGFRIFSDEEEHVCGRVRGKRGRDEDGELLPIGEQVPIGSEIQNEPDAYERRPDDREDGDEFRRRGFFGFQSVMRQKPFGLGLGHDSRLDERRHVGRKLLVKV